METVALVESEPSSDIDLSHEYISIPDTLPKIQRNSILSHSRGTANTGTSVQQATIFRDDVDKRSIKIRFMA